MLFFWKKQQKSINNYFSIMISFAILVVVLASAFYYFEVSKRLVEISMSEKNFANASLSNLIFKTAKKDIEINNFKSLNNISESLIQNRLIAYVAVYDSSNEQYLWSTIKDVTTSKNKFDSLISIYTINTPSYYKNSSYSEVKGNMDHYEITIGFETESTLASYINVMIKNNQILAILFIILGFIIATLMSSLISIPLIDLSKGAEELSNGNLKCKLKLTDFKEINKLVNAFNEMANKLNSSYALLEQKVKDRTQELENANEELKSAQSMMVHSEKMRSLGEMVAGITHEINNPINFIYGNLTHLKEYSENLLDIIAKYEETEGLISEELKNELTELKETKELEFIRDDMADLIKSCQEGANRTKHIIADLKNFSRLEEMVVNDVDIHKEIDTIINILHSKLKNNINLHKEYGEIPNIESYGGQINQVFMNILDNASFAVKDGGDIWVRTKQLDENVVIEFEDNGCGIDKKHVGRIFEPFFTTKSVGEGTGLGMSISYKVIKNHNGNIEIESEVGKGTKLTITLPIKGLKQVQKELKSETAG